MPVHWQSTPFVNSNWQGECKDNRLTFLQTLTNIWVWNSSTKKCHRNWLWLQILLNYVGVFKDFWHPIDIPKTCHWVFHQSQPVMLRENLPVWSITSRQLVKNCESESLLRPNTFMATTIGYIFPPPKACPEPVINRCYFLFILVMLISFDIIFQCRAFAGIVECNLCGLHWTSLFTPAQDTKKIVIGFRQFYWSQTCVAKNSRSNNS